jgi:DASS family divalent anion:Na+ symporter
MTNNEAVKVSNTTAVTKNFKKPFIIILGLIVAIVIARITPPAGLTPAAMIYLGVFVCTLIYLVTNIISDFVVSMLFMAAFALFNVGSFPAAFSPFSSTTIWLLIGALAMGAAAAKCGLLKRVTYLVMKVFPETYRGMIMAVLGAGCIISPMIPSVTAKVAIMAPLSRSISETLGFKAHSKGAAGLFSAMLISAYVVGVGFLSGSILSYLLLGFLPAQFKAEMTWVKWFLCALPWTITVVVLSYFVIMVLFKPTQAVSLTSGFAAKALEDMGPIKKSEKIVGIIIACTLILWMGERILGIDSSIVGLVAGALTFAFGILEREEFRSSIPWDSVVFIGGILSIAGFMTTLKVDVWIGKLVGGYISPLLANIWLFAILASVIIYLVRMVIISQLASMTIFMTLLVPLAVSNGLNPWTVCFIVVCGVLTWNLAFQTTTFMAAWSAAGGDEFVTHKETLPMSIAYMVISIIGILISIPFWKMMGMIP